jgi:hypothetical protein
LEGAQAWGLPGVRGWKNVAGVMGVDPTRLIDLDEMGIYVNLIKIKNRCFKPFQRVHITIYFRFYYNFYFFIDFSEICTLPMNLMKTVK